MEYDPPCQGYQLARNIHGGEVMRPDKPGYWWYKTSYGTERIADIFDGYSCELCVIKNHRPVRVSVFECSSDFGEWLGQAHPSKKVDRYQVLQQGPITTRIPEVVDAALLLWMDIDD